jgi:opacity protein-like surface antigen
MRTLALAVLAVAMTAIPSFAQTDQPTKWIASGSFGRSFGGSTKGPSANLGASLAYRFKEGRIGIEVIAQGTPNFQARDSRFDSEPKLNSYMGNIVFYAPRGPAGRVQPYAAGGFGAMQFMSDVKPFAASGPAVVSANEFKPGFDVGGGVILITSTSGDKPALGFVADVRFFKAVSSTGNTSTPEFAYADSYLSGASIWRTSFGIVVGW